MTEPLIASALMVAVLVGVWAIGAWRHRSPKPPQPTPWADSTQVAQRVREMEAADDGR